MEQTFGVNWRSAAAGVGLTVLVFISAFALALY
jgi:hypothetical protein